MEANSHKMMREQPHYTTMQFHICSGAVNLLGIGLCLLFTIIRKTGQFRGCEVKNYKKNNKERGDLEVCVQIDELLMVAA